MMMKTRTGTGSAGVVTRAALCGIGSGACPQVTAGSQKGEMARGRSRNRERSDPRSRSGRSREPSKVRPPLSSSFTSQNNPASDTLLPFPNRLASPCKQPSSVRKPSPDGDATATFSVNLAIPDQAVLQADNCFCSQGQEDVLTLPESHLDPMLHEAAVQYSIYSPDTNSLRAVSPVFVFSSFAEQVTQVHGASVAGQVNNQAQAALVVSQVNNVEEFIDTLSTPLQPPLLPALDANARHPSHVKVTIPAISSAQCHSERLLGMRRAGAKLETFAQEIMSKKFGIIDDHASFDDNIKKIYLQRYKKPLSPSFLKTITELAEKGGCKSIRLKAARKKAAIAPL